MQRGLLESQPSRGSPRAHTLTELIHQDRGDDFVLVVARLPQDVVRVLVDTAAALYRCHPVAQ